MSFAAQAFKLDRVSFYENGIVSLNLPPVGNVLGTRATRTTHPQTLARFTDFLSAVFESGTPTDNPFFWRTKKDVVETIARLNMGGWIAHDCGISSVDQCCNLKQVKRTVRQARNKSIVQSLDS